LPWGTPESFSVRSVSFVGIAAVRSIIAYALVTVPTLGLHVVPPLLTFLTAMEQTHHSALLPLGVASVCFFTALLTELIVLSLECGAFLAGLAFVNVSRDAQASFT
jgi:Kef-type K+ transport system membrane component KefB